MAKNYEKAYKDYKAGMAYKDIASKYSVSINTVKSWKTRQWRDLDAECAHKEQEKAHKTTQRHYTAEARKRMQERGKHFAEVGAEASRRDSANVKAARQMVEYKKAHRPPAYGVKDIGKMLERISNYFLICDNQGVAYTRAGIVIALDVSRATYSRYRDGELDYLLEEYIAINNIDLAECETITADNGAEIKIDAEGNPLIPFSAIIQKALLRLEDQAEQRLYSKGRPGDIFTLKQYGWMDEKSPGTVNQTLVIAPRDEADEALKLLYGGK